MTSPQTAHETGDALREHPPHFVANVGRRQKFRIPAICSGPKWIYLAWTVKGDRIPPLVTTSPAGTPLGQAGVLGAPAI